MAVAEALGDFFVVIGDLFAWAFVNLGAGGLAIGLLIVWVVWRTGLTFGPMKLCYRCKGKGHVGGFLGGRRKCGPCAGEGIRPRVGSGK